MKKIISLVLMLVLIFSMAVPSFASEIMPLAGDHNTELEALNEISYWVYWIHSDFSTKLDDIKNQLIQMYVTLVDTVSLYLYQIRDDVDILQSDIHNSLVPNSSNSLAQLLDINDFTRSSYDEIKKIRENLFGDSTQMPSFAEGVSSFLSTISGNVNVLKTREQFLWTSGDIANTIDWDNYKTSWYYMVYDNLNMIYDDVNMLQEVLADEDDLALKESQKSNQEQAEEYFMSGNSTTTSIGGNDIFRIQDFTNVFIDFFGNSSVSGSSSSMSNATDSLNSYLTPNFSDLENYPFAWFILVDSDINRVSSTYSLRDPNRIVTSYYDDNLSKIENIFGGFN